VSLDVFEDVVVLVLQELKATQNTISIIKPRNGNLFTLSPRDESKIQKMRASIISETLEFAKGYRAISSKPPESCEGSQLRRESRPKAPVATRRQRGIYK